jgi:3-methyladenine DNA glycosylase/8-oxoguanine DNA glycosylase
MNYSMLMNVYKCFNDLTHIDSCLMFSETLSSFHQIFKCIIPTILKQNVNIFFIFESLNKLNNVFVLESFMNFDLD